MNLTKKHFIKAPVPFQKDFTLCDPAPMFRKAFTIGGKIVKATLAVCGLGYGYYWLNGKRVSEDLFTAPISNYNETLWYNVYDVASLLTPGENVAAAMLGNGFFNESVQNPWRLEQADWRDVPKFAFALEIEDENGLQTIVSDSTWKCFANGPVRFHQIHSGEYYDARLYNPAWNTSAFCDAAWQSAVQDENPPKGVLRECMCEPIRACAIYPAIHMTQTGEGRYLFDIGQNISGYVRLRIRQPAGTQLVIRYAEQIHADNSLNLNHMDSFFPSSEFEQDRFICSGAYDEWSPMFTYHGFRYIEISGVCASIDAAAVAGVFVHQKVEDLTEFFCSNPMLNQLYACGKMATLSNLFYMPTDCPTREKLGWTNDAQASMNQMFTNFNVKRLMEKWMQDIFDSMDEKGCLPAIIPTSGWGYDAARDGKVNGPVSEGILFEVPYKLYLYTGDDTLLRKSMPYFRRYLAYLKSTAHESGLIGYGLIDWAGPFEPLDNSPTPIDFIGTVFYIKFLRIAAFTARHMGNTAEQQRLEQEVADMTQLFRQHFTNEDGTCTIHEQTAVSLMIYYNLYTDFAAIKNQLLQTVEQHHFHHHCGMVGLRRLYYALNQCGLFEEAYRVITATGFPSYSDWLEGDATTLWEEWTSDNSKNHHMYSDVLNWLMNTLAGIAPTIEAPGYQTLVVAPAFVQDISCCKAVCNTANGRVKTEWSRQKTSVRFFLEVPAQMQVRFQFLNARIVSTVQELSDKVVRYKMMLEVE